MRVFSSRFVGFILILFILCALLIALLPTVASTSWGRKQVVSWVNRSIPGNIEIRNLDLRWGKGQVVEGLLLKDPEGKSVLEVERFSTEATLWQLINKSTRLGFTQIQELNAAIVTDSKGLTNLQRALGISLSPDTIPLLPSTIVLSDVNADIYLFASSHPLSAWIKGLTRQENLNGSFEINVSLDGLEATDWEGLKKDAQNSLSSQEAKIQAHVNNFPVDLIDRLVALKNPDLNGLFHSLLGDRLNLTIDKEPSKEGLAFNLTALAPLMQGDVKGKIVNKVLTLQEPAIFHFNLTPQSVNPFTHDHFELLNETRLEVVFSTLSFPLDFLDSESTVDPCLFGFQTEFKLPETAVDVSLIGHLNILSLQAKMSSPVCDKTIQLQVVGKAQHGKEPFNIQWDSTLTKPKNFSQLFQQVRQNMQASLNISHLPLEMIPFLKQHPEWKEQMGSYADAQVTIHPTKGKEEWNATLALQTPRLALQEAQFRLGKEIVLAAPAELNWTTTTDCLSTILKVNELNLDEPCSLQLILNQFQLPLENPELAKFQFEATLPLLQFSHLLSWGTAKFQNLTLKVEGQDSTQFHSKLNGQVALLTPAGAHSPLLPEPLTFTQTSNWKREVDGKMEMPSSQLQLHNSITNALVKARLNSQDQLEITQPTQIDYTLSPLALQTLSDLLGKKWPILLEPIPLHITLEPTSFDLKTFSIASLHVEGMLETNRIALQDASGALPVLKDIEAPWVVDAPQNNFHAEIKGLAYIQNDPKPSQISAYAQVWPKEGAFDVATTSAEIRMDFSGMPTSILNILLATDDLSPVLGPIIDLNLKAFFDPTQEKPGYWDLRLDSLNFHMDGRLNLTEAATISDSEKLPTLRLTMTPESYQYLQKILAIQDQRKLAAPFTLLATLSELYLPLKHAWPDQTQVHVDFSTHDIQWLEAGAVPIKIEGQIKSQNLMQQVNVSIQARSTSPLTFDGIFTQVFDTEGHLRPWQEMGLKANIQGQQLTPAFLQNLFLLGSETRQKLQAFFGETLDVNASCQLKNLSGPLQTSVKGSQGLIELEGQLQQGVLTLKKPLEGSVKMTPLLSQTFLAPHVPFLSTAIDAENPIKFMIESSQFSCPLIPFQLDQVRIGKGTLDLGKIRFRNAGELSSILSLIHPISDQYLTIWFTPLYFQLEQGILSFKRLDLLVAHAYTLATWGNLNLKSQQADLVLGLSAQTLQYAFGIQGLDEHYFLQIPLRSAKGKIELDKKQVMARLSSLVAQTQVKEKGKLLGNILDRLMSEKGENIPAPTTQPFPWEKEFKSSSSQQPDSDISDNDVPPPPEKQSGRKKKKRKLLDADGTIKNLQEGAGQLLDQWFGK